jgi:hypothetical protein
VLAPVARANGPTLGRSPTHVDGTAFMSALLVAQSTFPLLELSDVDLAPGEALLEDVERRARGLAGRPEQRVLRAAEPAHQEHNHPNHNREEQDQHQKAEEHVEQTAIPHHPGAAIAFTSHGKRWQDECDEHGYKRRIAKPPRRSPDGTNKGSSLTAGIGAQTFCITASATGAKVSCK